MLIGFAIAYAVLTVIHGVIAVIVFAFHYKEWGPQDEDTQFAAKVLIATPVWPLFWGKKLIVLVATAAGITNKKEESE